MGKYKFNVGDRLQVVEASSKFSIGDIVTCCTKIDSNNDDTIEITLPNGERDGGWCASRFKLVKETPSKNVYKMKKTIYHVLVVNKKTGKEMKNVTISADNEQQAILKTFGVDAENTFIKVTEEGSYEEDKPLKAVLEKKE